MNRKLNKLLAALPMLSNFPTAQSCTNGVFLFFLKPIFFQIVDNDSLSWKFCWKYQNGLSLISLFPLPNNSKISLTLIYTFPVVFSLQLLDFFISLFLSDVFDINLLDLKNLIYNLLRNEINTSILITVYTQYFAVFHSKFRSDCSKHFGIQISLSIGFHSSCWKKIDFFCIF